MIDFKKTTQAFSGSQQDAISRSEQSNGMGADQMAKLLKDGENVGDYLNKIANPNYTKTTLVKGHGRNELNKDDFLKLMLAQMKHQDPTNPLKSHEMAAQMAQFTSVEQLTNINKGIEAMGAQQSGGGGGGGYDALSFIGKIASGDSSKVMRNDGDEKHSLNFNLLDNAMDVKIEVKDAAGNLVKTLEVKDLKKGKNSVNWAGLTEDGLQARAGEYYFNIEARASSGKKVHAQTKFEGTISGVKFSPAGPVLMIGNQSVGIQDIKQLVDPRYLPQQNLPSTQGQKNDPKLTQDLMKKQAIQQNIPVRKQAEVGNLDSLGMASGFMNKLNKVTK